MSDSAAIENESMADAFKSGYSSKQIIMSIVCAFLLHGAILGGYMIMGSEKKSQKSAEKTEKKEDVKAAPAVPGDLAKTEPAKADSTDPARRLPNPAVDGKKPDVAKPGEIPAAPDSDIDSILKAK